MTIHALQLKNLPAVLIATTVTKKSRLLIDILWTIQSRMCSVAVRLFFI
jgi:hypothetical protein